MKKYKIQKGNNAVMQGKKLHVMKAKENRIVYVPDNVKVLEKADSKLSNKDKEAVKQQKRIK